MNMDKNNILKMVGILALVCLIVTSLTSLTKSNSLTLYEYAKQNPEIAYQTSQTPDDATIYDVNTDSVSDTNTALDATSNTGSSTDAASDSVPNAGSSTDAASVPNAGSSTDADSVPNAGSYTDAASDSNTANAYDTNSTLSNTGNSMETTTMTTTSLIGASLNGISVIDERITYADSFYYEPLSDKLCRYITGISYPAVSPNVLNDASATIHAGNTPTNFAQNEQELAVSYDDLCYLHILHYDFDGNPAEGELICNKAIAQDLVEIFYELYRNEYQLEKVLLIDEYDGDDLASMEDNNTSCFNYRLVEGTSSLSKHALGLAIDVNPFYNPYVTYEKDGTQKVSPLAAAEYADRDTNFPYKIDENDLCYKLFIEHGFIWGGNWNSCKDYQHFQKPLEK